MDLKIACYYYSNDQKVEKGLVNKNGVSNYIKTCILQNFFCNDKVTSRANCKRFYELSRTFLKST